MSDSFTNPWIVACQAPLSMAFPRQEYWSGLPFPPPGDLPNPGSKPASPALEGGFFTRVTRKACFAVDPSFKGKVPLFGK